MKTLLRAFIYFLFLLMALSEQGTAQSFTDPAATDPGYEARKRLAKQAVARNRTIQNNKYNKIIATSRLTAEQDTVSCMIPVYPAFTTLPRSDDGSYGPFNLPFTFNLYGKSYNQVWINNNGSLTFNGPFSGYSAQGFPINDQPMVAAFWGDVDTRDTASGQVHYMMTPTALLVNWDHVGYHDGGVDKTNTFQIIIGTKESPYIGYDANIKFSYNDMQWATAGGFGGSASTVGVNGGDGIHYFQVGRFSDDGFAYDGPGGNNDGINYLDYKCFSFDGTYQQNMPPTAMGLPQGNFVDINVGDTANLDIQFIAPEVGETVSLAVDTQGICKVDYTVTNGVIAKLKLRIIGDSCNAGFHFIKLVATDNGNPQQSTTIYLIVNVNIEMLDQEITFPTPVDENGDGHMALKATASSGLPIFYTVESGSAYIAGDSLIVEGGGQITIRAHQFGNGLYKPAEKDVTICVPLKQPVVIKGNAEVCNNAEETYYIQDFYSTNLLWSVSEGGTVEGNGNIAKVRWNTVGTHTISVRYTSECSGPGPVQTFTVQVTDNALNGPFTNLLPADGNSAVDLPITFSWSPIVNAKEYALYVWADTASRPEIPFIDHITGINYTLFYDLDILQYEKKFKWQVVAKNVCYTLESPVQTFTFRKLPDLAVTDVQVPATGFSGQSFGVRWQVKNTGQGATLAGQWIDRVYLSTDKTLDSADIELGAVLNMSALNAGDSYVNTVSFTLPQGISDKFYVMVAANRGGTLEETDKTNNAYITTSPSSIQLTPPPDLKVVSVVPPTIAFAGQWVNIQWTVTNAGVGPVTNGQWSDYVYLSKKEYLNTDSAMLLSSGTESGLLNVGADYIKTASVRIPDSLFGKYYVYVITDANNAVYEHAAEGNNTGRSDSINIVLTPPVDLVVRQVTIPGTADNKESIAVSWRVENAGGSSTDGKGWRDKVYLSKTAVLHEQEALLLGIFQRPLSLGQGEGYTMQRNLTIPAGITGNYYLLVKTDAEDMIFEYDYENNNTGVSAQPLNIVTPDLVVTQVTAPASTASGKTIMVGWTVRNNGTGKVYNTSIKDRILLSASSTFIEANCKVLKEVVYQTGELPAGEDTVKQAMVILPEGISGNYYIYVQTDSANAVYETNDNNNVLRSTGAVVVTLSPWADLQVTSVQITDTATAAGLLSVSYTGINKGNAAADTAWKDRIYLSLKPQWDTAGSILLREVPLSKNLEKDSSYRVNTTVLLPGEGGDTTYYIYVFANAGREVYEHTDSMNNVRRSNGLYIKKYPPVDLTVTSITAPVAASSGKPIKIKWSVMNQGQAVTLSGQWSDGLYLSTDTIWDNGDRFVKGFTHRGTLTVGAGYTDEQDFTIPNGISGSYYLLLVTDRNNENHDADSTNNYRLVRQGNGGSNDPAPINIELTPPPDLVVTTLDIPDEGIAGQPVSIKWTVKNAGTGITAATGWTDKVYLSDDLEVDTADQVVGTYTRIGALSPGASYTDSLQVFLPNDITGNHILIFKTDVNDNVYEHGAEENTSTHLIHVTKAPLTDLIVTDITVPDTVVAGEPVTLQWKLRNTGINPVWGYMQEGIYLSTDTTKDVNDIVAGLPDAYYNIPPQSIISRSLTTTLSGLSLQDYHVIIQADIRNNIAETSDANNSAVSDKAMKVMVEELPLQVVKQRILPSKKDIYYRIEIPDSLAGESLLISLKGDSVNGHNEMYLRFGDVPTRAVFDFAHTDPFAGNQEIVAPVLKAGTYYLLINGYTPYTNRQPISLLASILHFEVRSVEAAKGGNTGFVTIQVKGAKLGTVGKLRLRNGGTVIEADKVTISSPASLFARFSLQGAPLGVYDVVAENSEGDTAILQDGFTIEAGHADGLATNVLAPPSTRPSNVILLRVQFTNTGNTDIINPVLKLTSLGGAPIAFEPSELANNTKVLSLKLRELNGPAGILRPGASGTILVYAKATTVLGFMLMNNGQ